MRPAFEHGFFEGPDSQARPDRSPRLQALYRPSDDEIAEHIDYLESLASRYRLKGHGSYFKTPPTVPSSTPP
jgi:hypothetical protein